MILRLTDLAWVVLILVSWVIHLITLVDSWTITGSSKMAHLPSCVSDLPTNWVSSLTGAFAFSHLGFLLWYFKKTGDAAINLEDWNTQPCFCYTFSWNKISKDGEIVWNTWRDDYRISVILFKLPHIPCCFFLFFFFGGEEMLVSLIFYFIYFVINIFI